MCAFYHSSERSKSKLRNLEKLFSPRDADDCDAKDTAQDEIGKCKLPSGYDHPDDIDKKRNSSTLIPYFFAKRVQRD